MRPYNGPVPPSSSGLVDIVREFLAVEEAVGSLRAGYSRGQLRWDDVQELVSDSEASSVSPSKLLQPASATTTKAADPTLNHFIYNFLLWNPGYARVNPRATQRIRLG